MGDSNGAIEVVTEGAKKSILSSGSFLADSRESVKNSVTSLAQGVSRPLENVAESVGLLRQADETWMAKMNSPKQILGDSVAVAVGVVGLIAVTNTYNTVLSTMQMRDHRDVHKTIQNINHMIQIQSWCSDEERIAVLQSEGYAVVVTKEQWLYLRRDTQETVFTSLSSVLVNHKKIYMMRGDYHYSKESGPIELNQDVQIHAEPGTRLLVTLISRYQTLFRVNWRPTEQHRTKIEVKNLDVEVNWLHWGFWRELYELNLRHRFYPDWKPVIYRKRDNVLFFSDNSRLFVPCMKPWVRRVALNMFSVFTVCVVVKLRRMKRGTPSALILSLLGTGIFAGITASNTPDRSYDEFSLDEAFFTTRKAFIPI